MNPRSFFKPRCGAQVEVVFDGRGSTNSKPFYLEIEPRNASVGLNGFYEADTWSMDFDAKILPFDPDQVAYAAARIYMWDDEVRQGEWAIDDNLMVDGLVDDIETEIVGEDNMVSFSGRDNTGLLADPEWNPKDKVPAGDTLDVVVQGIADAAAPEGTRARFEVVWAGQEPPPSCGGLGRSTKKKGLWVKPGKTYWDVIWDLCIQHAYVPHIEGSQIIITEPITQTIQTLDATPSLVYGKSLTGLTVRRKFGHEKVPQIVLVAWDPVTKKKIEVKYPKKRNIDVQATANRNAQDAKGIKLTVKKDEQMFFPAPKGVTDEKALERYARMRFYHLGRGETTYEVTTNHLWIPGQTGGEVNLLRLRPGAAIGVKFDPFLQDNLRRMTYGERVDHIISRGYHQEVANFVAGNIDRMELFNQHYYYNRGDVSYDIDDGIEIKIEAVNFASEVREINFMNADIDV